MSDEAGDVAAALARIEICLDDIEGVLGRLIDGSYGSCSSCGHEIGDERLLVEPTTRWCGQCAPRIDPSSVPPAGEEAG
ncbi:MAG: TraR/DksA C4-type zinc finger protein [Actinomycetota bacterium]|nr:TraR/DksA C4-type zinc finger protein [Actinomycetota bacterium]